MDMEMENLEREMLEAESEEEEMLGPECKGEEMLEPECKEEEMSEVDSVESWGWQDDLLEREKAQYQRAKNQSCTLTRTQ